MTCPYCGETITGDEKYCSFCGKKITGRHLAETNKKIASETNWFKQPDDFDMSDTNNADIGAENNTNASENSDNIKKEQAEIQNCAEQEYKEESNFTNTNTNTDNILKRTEKVIIHLKNKKQYIILAAAIAVACIIVIGYFLMPHTVNKPCDHCNRVPSVAFDTSDGSKAYVCLECMKTCMICDRKRATHHYENMIGTIMFVCDDCYKEVDSY